MAYIEGKQESLNGLEIEQEVEDLELYGEGAAIEQARRESIEIEKDTRRLERSIKKMKVQKKKAKQKYDRLANRYEKSEAIHTRVSAKAEKTENIRDKQLKKTNNLEMKVIALEESAIDAKNRNAQAVKDIKNLKRKRRNLLKRLKNAERILSKQKKRMKTLKKKRSKLKARTNKLGNRVDFLEAKIVKKTPQKIAKNETKKSSTSGRR